MYVYVCMYTIYNININIYSQTKENKNRKIKILSLLFKINPKGTQKFIH